MPAVGFVSVEVSAKSTVQSASLRQPSARCHVHERSMQLRTTEVYTRCQSPCSVSRSGALRYCTLHFCPLRLVSRMSLPLACAAAAVCAVLKQPLLCVPFKQWVHYVVRNR